tara:strand:+ start:256 stop:951 length:696 start_codon:yes stop_codon:yes gene_type:complete
MATIKDFERDKKEIEGMIKTLNSLCESGSKSVIKRELTFIQQKVNDTNTTIDRFLNVMSNIEQRPLAQMKDSLQELIVQLETSVCVPEFCVNDNIHGSCQNLTKKLIDNLQEIMFCYQLTDMTRATNIATRKPGVNKTQSVYQSIAPNSNLIRNSMRRKKLPSCKRKLKEVSKGLPQEVGRFSVTSTPVPTKTTTVGKKKVKKSKKGKTSRSNNKNKNLQKKKKRVSSKNK